MQGDYFSFPPHFVWLSRSIALLLASSCSLTRSPPGRGRPGDGLPPGTVGHFVEPVMSAELAGKLPPFSLVGKQVHNLHDSGKFLGTVVTLYTHMNTLL